MQDCFPVVVHVIPLDNYICDFFIMLYSIEVTMFSILESYDCIIFEGVQGFLLDQNNTDYMPHLTPSTTGIKNPINIIVLTNIPNPFHDSIRYGFINDDMKNRIIAIKQGT